MKKVRYLCLFLAWVTMARAETFLVLPFFNQSANANLDWIGESFAEALREALIAEGVLVLDRDSRLEAFRRLGLRPQAELTRASVVKVGEALDVGYVVYGSYEVSGDQSSGVKPSLRAGARVLDLRKMIQTPEYSEIGALDDLASMQSRLAWQTLRRAAPRTSLTEEEFRRRHPPIRLDAMEQYIRGLLTPAEDQKHRFLTQAARLDPAFSQPAFQLAKIYWRKKDYRIASDWLRRVKPEDAHFQEATFLLGLCRYYLGDYSSAQQSFQTVVQTVPLNEVWNNLGAAQSRRDQPEALDNFRKALDGDASDPDYQFNVGLALWKRKDFAAAADRFRAVLDRSPDDQDATVMLGRCLQQSGPRPGDTRTEGLERLKHGFEESAYLQLKAVLETAK